MAYGERRFGNVAGPGWAVKHGLVGGVVAGVVFAMFEMLVALLLSGDLFAPLRSIAGIPLGGPPSQIALGTAMPVGLATHMVLSMFYGVIAAFVVSAVTWFLSSGARTVVFATVYGLLLWVVNFFVVAPLIGAAWFMSEPNQFWQGFVAHTFFFGTVLGLYLAYREPSVDTEVRPIDDDRVGAYQPEIDTSDAGPPHETH